MTIPNAKAKKQVKSGAKKVKKEDVNKILNQKKKVQSKMLGSGKLKHMLDDVKMLMSLLQDFKDGKYRIIPWWTIAAIVATIIYLLNPIDLIPDFIPIVGLTDDAAVLGACLALIESDFAAYKEWKQA